MARDLIICRHKDAHNALHHLRNKETVINQTTENAEVTEVFKKPGLTYAVQ